jgi:hypothetical protein
MNKYFLSLVNSHCITTFRRRFAVKEFNESVKNNKLKFKNNKECLPDETNLFGIGSKFSNFDLERKIHKNDDTYYASHQTEKSKSNLVPYENRHENINKTEKVNMSDKFGTLTNELDDT